MTYRSTPEPNEAAEYLRTNPKQLRRWVYQGKIRAYKLLGKSLRFKRSELDLFKGGRSQPNKSQV